MARRYIFSDRLLSSIGKIVPYYRVNCSETDPFSVTKLYEDSLSEVRYSLEGKSILEVGSGITNGVGYVLATRGAQNVSCYEPYAGFNSAADQRIKEGLLHHPRFNPERERFSRVKRTVSLETLPHGGFDLVLSHSVLEHVLDLSGLFRALRALLNDSGVMLHIVDYRDHFFKYPYHFLQFERTTWNRYLNPGDLPRWRLTDHLTALEQAGFASEILNTESDLARFNSIKARLSSDFNPADPNLSVLKATIFSRPGPK